LTVSPRNDRDRYVAFAFAAADLLLELDPELRVRFVAGASQNLLGRSAKDLEGVSFLELIDPGDRRYVRRLLTSLSNKGRHEPASVRLLHVSGRQPRVMLGGCRLPSDKSVFYLTITLIHAGMVTDSAGRDAKTQLLTKEALLSRAQALAAESDATGVIPALALLNLNGFSQLNQALPAERSEALLGEISAVLRSESVGGDGAGRISDEAFGVLHAGGGFDLKRLQAEIEKAANGAAGAENLPMRVETRVASLDLDASSLDERDAARALAFAMASFAESHGDDFTLHSLSDGFAQLVDRTVVRVADFRELIRADLLTLAYQPIVMLNGRKVHHYEALARLPDGGSPYETVTFGEQVGLAEELDLSVCQRALLELSKGAAGTRIAVNLSGRSLQNSRFLSKLEHLLDDKLPRASAGLVMFEVTESSTIADLDKAANFLTDLRLRGHPICLDDFGAGAAGYNYLRRISVDFVKIDGPFLKSAVAGDKRDRALIRGIAATCGELRCHTIGEMIENEGDARIAIELGLELGQGWLFGKAGNLPPRT
jgi:EAL domain-containing protein (putative c-di-GMP-specific phosphodiesterase class I)/GGDEF domain-containing protein